MGYYDIFLLALESVGWPVFWKTIHCMAGFYMQRLHYEQPEMTGNRLSGPKILAVAANLMAWILTLLAVYVWYRLGWLATAVFILIPFLIGLAFDIFEITLLKLDTARLALISVPVALVTFIMTVFSIVTI